MTDSTRKKLLQEIIEDVIADFVIIRSGGTELRFTNNTEDVKIGDKTYTATAFDFSSGDVYASDSTNTLKFTDLDRIIIQLVQTAEEGIEVEVFSASLSDLESCIDGPQTFEVSSAQVSSGKDEVALSLGKKSILSYNVSCHTYNNRLFPGLY